VEGIPPSTIPIVVCPLANGAADPTVSVPDISQIPLTNPDSAAQASKNLEVFRGLSELELLKLLEQLPEQVPAPVLSTTSGAPEEASRGTSFQTGSVTEIRNTIRLDTTPPAGDTGNGGVAATSNPRGTLPVPPSLFSDVESLLLFP
jgi:hypothetical protein